MIVVDASVLTNALTDDGPLGAVARRRLSADSRWAAPDHLTVEVFSAIRGRLLGGKVGRSRAESALVSLRLLSVELVSVRPLLGRMWEMRDNVSGYDAAYLALAETYDSPLVTADARLATVPGAACEVVLAIPEGR